ncbi:hypothetical protein EYF80_048371 [Liparis tanakae]|uniref:Uncharacterized protein n=1 Tax=Liparis tanakae TaxID=230148 RepID=A0A4Z2FKG4_9TELE|nr:hypothetical protein EYF80_048371 [Liparis tanakae]
MLIQCPGSLVARGQKYFEAFFFEHPTRALEDHKDLRLYTKESLTEAMMSYTLPQITCTPRRSALHTPDHEEVALSQRLRPQSLQPPPSEAMKKTPHGTGAATVTSPTTTTASREPGAGRTHLLRRPPVVKKRLKINLQHFSRSWWSCTSREDFRHHELRECVPGPVILVTRDENESSFPKGDTDARRNRERMSVTTSTASFPELTRSEGPDPMTRSHVRFSPARLSDLHYTTTAKEHYGRRHGQRARAGVQLSGGPALNYEDYTTHSGDYTTQWRLHHPQWRLHHPVETTPPTEDYTHSGDYTTHNGDYTHSGDYTTHNGDYTTQWRLHHPQWRLHHPVKTTPPIPLLVSVGPAALLRTCRISAKAKRMIHKPAERLIMNSHLLTGKVRTWEVSPARLSVDNNNNNNNQAERGEEQRRKEKGRKVKGRKEKGRKSRGAGR